MRFIKVWAMDIQLTVHFWKVSINRRNDKIQ